MPRRECFQHVRNEQVDRGEGNREDSRNQWSELQAKKASEPITSLMSVSKNKRDRCIGDSQTPCSLRTATVTPEPWRDVLDFERHHEARSRTCHRISRT